MGTAILGRANAASASGSAAVTGINSATSGTAFGVTGEVSSPAGIAGLFDNHGGGLILSGQANGIPKFTVDGSGSITASSFSGSGSGLTGVNAAMLNGLASTAFAPASGSPSYVSKAGDTMTGTLTVPTLQTAQINSGAGSSGSGLDLSMKANDATASGGNGGKVNVNAGNSFFNGLAGGVNIVGGNGFGTSSPGGAVSIVGGNGTGGGAAVNIIAGDTNGFGSFSGGTVSIQGGNSNGAGQPGGNIILTPGTGPGGPGTVRTSSEIRMGSETGTEAPVVSSSPGYLGLVIRRINSKSTTAGSVVAKTDTMTLVRDGTATGFQINVAAATGDFSIACLGLTNTTTVVGFTDSFVDPSATVAQVFNQTDLQQFNCSFGNTVEGHMTEVNLLRHPTGSTWVGTVTSTYNQ